MRFLAVKKNEYSTRSTSTGNELRTTRRMHNPLDIYHEKQVKALCALHALNNLFQKSTFTQKDLDTICQDLSPDSWLNPHKSWIGLGNYDINVIMTALQGKYLEMTWFDKRKDPSTIENLENIFGFILNVPSDCKVGWLSLPLKRKHWFTIKRFGEDYFNLDSKFEQPLLIGRHAELMIYLREELSAAEKQLFIIIPSSSSASKTSAVIRSGLNNPSSSTAMELGSSNSRELTDENMITDEDDKRQPRKESEDSGVQLMDLVIPNNNLNVIDLNDEDNMMS
jgi:josephin